MAKPNLTGRIHAFREKHAKAEIAVFFLAGFLFDIATLSRIDDWLTLVQQAVYLSLLGMLLALEQRYSLKAASPPRWLEKPWRFSNDAIHFLFGSLLSSFALFYFKSASGLAALVFLVVLFGVLMANELPQFRSLGASLRFGLYAFCLSSYFAYVVPVLIGKVRGFIFVGAMVLAAVPSYFLFRKLEGWKGKGYAFKAVAGPALGVHVVLVLLYFARVIPPVPLSVQFIGIYHGVERDPATATYRLFHQRPDWKLWHNGDQLFFQREGDKPYCFVRVFAPNRFDDRIQIRWMYDDPKQGWRDYGAVPLKLTGGREQGFRTFATTKHAKPGDWRCYAETEDGRTIGYINFTVKPESATAGEPIYHVDRR